MEKVIINSYEEFEKLVGQQIGVSEWLEIPQERINQFADATLDHQWIHVDAERAKAESPYKSTIVHGYLTLSLLPYLWNQIIEVNNLKMMVNYGMDKMKFGQAVLSGQSVRLVADLHSLVNLRGVAKAEIKFSIEIKDQKKKALEDAEVKRNNTRSIRFEEIGLKDAMAKAKKENRLIFIDAYTDYCQPCMLMVKNVFSLNAVADFYNQNFINLKMHFGKEKELAEKYGTSGYPAFLFINGDGKLVYMESGYTEGDEFIGYGKTALEKAKGIEFIEDTAL